jgi:Mannosyl-glycoprotein endo-beta-N-acetylglucosaminidase
VHYAAAAVCVLCLLLPAAKAASIYDAGYTGIEATANTVVARLPLWVQVNAKTAPLYTTQKGSQSIDPALPRNTFLRVVSSAATRLEVDAYDDSGKVSAHGWIETNQTLPSAPGIGWLVTARPTALWRTPDPAADTIADAVRPLERFTPLLVIDGPVRNRVQVWTYRSDFSQTIDKGWVDLKTTGPALAPAMRIPAPEDKTFAMRVANATDQQQAFLDKMAQAARDSAALTGVPASVTVAQAILESDWGRSQLAQAANNFFGVKAMGAPSQNNVVWMPTAEYDAAGQMYQTVSAFRAYASLTDSLTDHDLLLETTSRYASAMRAAQDPKQFATLLAKAGYATDPAYADKLIALMDRYNLYQLDA